jgi:hypothetical protein
MRHEQIEIHEAVINALALAQFRKSRALDKAAFPALVRPEHERILAMKPERRTRHESKGHIAGRGRLGLRGRAWGGAHWKPRRDGRCAGRIRGDIEPPEEMAAI